MPETKVDTVFNQMEAWAAAAQLTPWVGTSPVGQNNFRQWATGAIAAMPAVGIAAVSCFEVILLAAAINQVITQPRLNTYYAYAGGLQGGPVGWARRWAANLAGATGAVAPQVQLQQRLSVYNLANGDVPRKGDIVLFNLSNAAYNFHHVAIATGLTYNGHTGLLSFYGAGANQMTPVIRTSIERMLAQGGQCYMMGGNSTVYYMHPPWQFY
jgi:hypothetical protein